jgi:hypothetical protein
MIAVTDEHLEAIRTKMGSAYKWKTVQTTSYYSSVEGRTLYGPKLENTILMFECLRCKQHYLHSECANCGAEQFEIGSGPGVYCSACELGFISWNCENCGTKNPVSKTLFYLMPGCFIATAAYGSPIAPEIVVLQQFRETQLRPRPVGRSLIAAYERLSPPLADAIAPHPGARLWVRRLLLAPVISAIRRWFP